MTRGLSSSTIPASEGNAQAGGGPTRRVLLAFGRDVAIRLGYCVCLPPVGSGVSVRQKRRVSGMRFFQCVSMLDRTKMLLRARRNFRNHGEQSVGIRTINASDLLHRVQIGQPPPIEDQVVSPRNLGYSVDRKADKLVEGNRNVNRSEEHTSELQ